MKKALLTAVALGILTAATGCSYGGASATADKVVIARNDGFLFGILRKVYVCKITDAGLSACSEADSP